jgi:DNA-binding XRE family transcriptional regulator
MWQLWFSKQAERALRKTSGKTARFIREGLEELAANPYRYNPNVRKLQGRPGYRLRVGNWRMAAGEEELIPAEVVYALLDGESPIRLWREYRGLTQQQTAEKVGISESYLSQLESGQTPGTPDVLSALANVLNLSPDDLTMPETIKENDLAH